MAIRCGARGFRVLVHIRRFARRWKALLPALAYVREIQIFLRTACIDAVTGQAGADDSAVPMLRQVPHARR